MSISFRVETLITGFFHLLWLTLLALFLLGESPDVILIFLAKVESGTAIFLFAVIVGVSFYLGTLAEHLLIVFNYWRKNEEGRNKIIESFRGTPAEIYGNKSFFLSAFSGLVILMVLLLLESSNGKWAISIIGIPLSLVTLIPVCFWKHMTNIKLKK